MNRGRVQAQGKGCEESEKWTQNNIPTKLDGIQMCNSLKNKLTKTQLKQRKHCFVHAQNFINNAPIDGYKVISYPIQRSYYKIPPERDIRVDVEIFKGSAFCG